MKRCCRNQESFYSCSLSRRLPGDSIRLRARPRIAARLLILRRLRIPQLKVTPQRRPIPQRRLIPPRGIRQLQVTRRTLAVRRRVTRRHPIAQRPIAQRPGVRRRQGAQVRREVVRRTLAIVLVQPAGIGREPQAIVAERLRLIGAERLATLLRDVRFRCEAEERRELVLTVTFARLTAAVCTSSMACTVDARW